MSTPSYMVFLNRGAPPEYGGDSHGDAWEGPSAASAAGPLVVTSALPPAPPSYQFKCSGWITSEKFASGDFRPTWLIKRVLVQGQPAVLGGPKKTLKTNILLDLALSLATRSPFLGKFEVAGNFRVAVISGESGEATLQETAQRICAAKKIEFAKTDIRWGFRLPALSSEVDLTELEKGLRENGVQVVAIDPLYLSLLSGPSARGKQASSMYDLGPMLMRVSQACLAAGATPILAHHTRKASRGEELAPIELDDLAFAGIGEFARQWLLLSRREKYNPETPGKHRLHLSTGGVPGTAEVGLWISTRKRSTPSSRAESGMCKSPPRPRAFSRRLRQRNKRRLW